MNGIYHSQLVIAGDAAAANIAIIAALFFRVCNGKSISNSSKKEEIYIAVSHKLVRWSTS